MYACMYVPTHGSMAGKLIPFLSFTNNWPSYISRTNDLHFKERTFTLFSAEWKNFHLSIEVLLPTNVNLSNMLWLIPVANNQMVPRHTSNLTESFEKSMDKENQCELTITKTTFFPFLLVEARSTYSERYTVLQPAASTSCLPTFSWLHKSNRTTN